MGLVVPAVLPSSREDLAEKLGRFVRIPAVTRVQIDVVDGRFASPMSWPYTSPSDLQSMIRKGEMLPHLERIAYEIDLMCLDADRTADDWLTLGASRLTFHAEGILDIPAFLASMQKKYGDVSTDFGIALNVASELSLIEPYLGQISYVQFMGIDSIGKQGQKFNRRTIEKIRTFRSRYAAIPIQVDGGVNLEVARELMALNVTNLVIGSALLRSSNPAKTMEAFEELESPFGV